MTLSLRKAPKFWRKFCNYLRNQKSSLKRSQYKIWNWSSNQGESLPPKTGFCFGLFPAAILATWNALACRVSRTLSKRWDSNLNCCTKWVHKTTGRWRRCSLLCKANQSPIRQLRFLRGKLRRSASMSSKFSKSNCWPNKIIIYD